MRVTYLPLNQEGICALTAASQGDHDTQKRPCTHAWDGVMILLSLLFHLRKQTYFPVFLVWVVSLQPSYFLKRKSLDNEKIRCFNKNIIWNFDLFKKICNISLLINLDKVVCPRCWSMFSSPTDNKFVFWLQTKVLNVR